MKNAILIALCGLTLAVAGCQTERQRLQSVDLLMAPPLSDSNSDGFWQTTQAGDTGLSEVALKKHVLLCQDTGASAQLIVHRSRMVSEWYSSSYSEPVGAMSSTKAVASLLIGLLVDRGLLAYDQKVSSVLPEWTGGLRDSVTIRELLTHSAGFDQRTSPGDSIGFVADKTAFVLGLFPDRTPGSGFSYSNEGAQLLEPIIRRATGQRTDEFAKAALFDRLGMTQTSLYAYGGSAWLYSEMRTTPRDMARIGVMMADGGIWNGEQIVSAQYVAEATRPSGANPRMGFLWWILEQRKTLNGFYASGYLNTDIYVFPAYKLVIVRTQAPRNGFTGKQESGDYFERAQLLFEEMVSETAGPAVRQHIMPLKGRRRTAQGRTAYCGISLR
jgi:CubicO group peptidase (beta-lactamase class C family)